jgi:hypothetical protein
MSKRHAVSIAKGQLLVIWIRGTVGRHIAEVVRCAHPMLLKAQQEGPLECLRSTDFRIHYADSARLQGAVEQRRELLWEAERARMPIKNRLGKVIN